MNRKTLIVALAILSLFLLSACSETEENGGQMGSKDKPTYRIGLITPLTGSAADFGIQQRAVLEYRIEELNKNNDFKIELVTRDGKCDVATATSVFEDLVEKEKINFIIGGHCSAATMAIAQIANKYDVVLLSPSTFNDDLEGMSPNVMSLSYKESALQQELANELMNYDRVAVLFEEGGDSEALERGMDNIVVTAGRGEILVIDEMFPRENTDFIDVMKKIKDSKVEVLLLNPSADSSAIALINAIAEQELSLNLIGQSTFNNQALLDKLDPALIEGMLIIDHPKVSGTQFASSYQKMVSEIGPLDALGNYFTATTLDALDVFAKLVSENNGDYKSVKKALATGTFTGNTGKIRFDGKSFVDAPAMQRLVVKEGKLVSQ